MDNFVFKKKFGQNFIKNKNIVERIVNISEIENDSLIIEVGPGMGILTEELVKKRVFVISYEIDTTLCDYLNNKFKNYNNIEFIYDDFIKRDITTDIEKYDYKKIYFIANVPYYITTPILMKVMKVYSIDKIVMMVQKEVGDRLCASCGSRDYSSISVYLDYFYERKKEFLVNRCEFMPVPNVDSIVISFKRRKELLSVKNIEVFFNIVRDSFQFKRKNIKNNLLKYDIKKIEEVLIKNGFNLSSRAEELPLKVFVEMSNVI